MDNIFLKLFIFLAMLYMSICFVIALINGDANGTIIFGMSLINLIMTLFLYYTFVETVKYTKK